MRFIDLFAGLGGFHLALRSLGHTCVFASEIDETLRALYAQNFSMECSGDIRQIDADKIPAHDILCAGFPCQPFSKAGRQSGLKDPELGGLYLQILKVIHYHQPTYLVLENVPNLEYHGDGSSWRIMEKALRGEGYNVDIARISPHNYGIPQIRKRIYIVGSRGPLNVDKRLRRGRKHKKISLKPFLKAYPVEARPVPKFVMDRLETWQEFLDLLPNDVKIPHPLWAMEFGATYPFKDSTPHATKTEDLRGYKGSFGCSLAEAKSRRDILDLLPSHARRKNERFPDWKVTFIQKNRDFYDEHSDILRGWVKKVKGYPSSFQKFEWNCHEADPKKEDRRLSRYVIQVRPSGVRVKRPTTAPSLVAMTSTQVPIIMWQARYITPTECKLLQSMEGLRYLPESDNKAYEALGNAVNVRVARRVAMALIDRAPVGSDPSSTPLVRAEVAAVPAQSPMSPMES